MTDNLVDFAEDLRDITPSPRILRTLGEIPYLPWQCIAELVDNSLDMFRGVPASYTGPKRVVVSWSNENVPANDRTLEVMDTGLGMGLDEIQQAVRAGYTSNDPINNLGLFGMGFNIATARLGDKTVFLSATPDGSEWVGIEIDFARLTEGGTFRAPVIRRPKSHADEHGTKIIVSRLKPDIYAQLRQTKKQIQDILADVYAPLLEEVGVLITVQSKALIPFKHCTWASSRYVNRRGVGQVPARLDIDEIVGEGLFDTRLNRYLTPDEEDEVRAAMPMPGIYPDGIVPRQQRVRGWLGIQRFSDPNDFGIDFIRNGRKILIRDKSLFSYQNPYTGKTETEYPVELGTTVGGRIVGEIHVDHIPPTYQKNDFNRTDATWWQVVTLLRGLEPILPLKRKAMGLTAPNDAPIARLVNAYRRAEAGTEHLAAPNATAKRYAEKFYDGDPTYLSDEEWWQVALEADREKANRGAGSAPPVDAGASASDDVSLYLDDGNQGTVSTAPTSPTVITSGGTPPTNTPVAPSPTPAESTASLQARSRQVRGASRDYRYPGGQAPYNVRVWEVTSGVLGAGATDDGVACVMKKDGNQLDFFYNPRHPLLREFPLSYRDFLLIDLANRFKTRDQSALAGVELTELFGLLLRENFPDQRIDPLQVRARANAFFDQMREGAVALLALRAQEVTDCIYEAPGEVEEIVTQIFSNADLLTRFQQRQDGVEVLPVAPARTLVRLVERFPEEFMDRKYFKMPYQTIALADRATTERLRAMAKDRLLSYLKDALWIISESNTAAPQTLTAVSRCSASLALLEEELAS